MCCELCSPRHSAKQARRIPHQLSFFFREANLFVHVCCGALRDAAAGAAAGAGAVHASFRRLLVLI